MISISASKENVNMIKECNFCLSGTGDIIF